ncbi:MAG: M48 family metallopeptidase [Planctomycetota bacterium]
MSVIQFECPTCKHRLRAPRAAAGRTATCRKCDAKIRVPDPTTASDQPQQKQKTAKQSTPRQATKNNPSKAVRSPQAANPQQAILKKIAEELDGKVPRNRLNIAYQLCLLLVAFFMVLMPLLYCCLIGLSCYGMYWYWTEVLPGAMENLPRGRAAIFAVLVYAAPLVAGSIMIVFMIKPVFFSLVLPRDIRQRSLKRASEPALFELVDRICDATRSPRPKRIDINNDVNASASLRRGFLSLFGKDLVLTIGAPLVAGMNTRQLAGVLGHEFGHFSQGAGMKSSYVIHTVNLWFARVVYQRDQLDESLERGIADGDYRISLLLMFAKLFVLLARAILWCFMMVAHMISCVMSQQMEYDADRYEAYISGSDYFENTSKRLIDLAAGQNAMYDTVVAAMSRSVLLDDLPGIAVAHAEKTTSKERKRIEAASEAGAGGLFSTHPPTEKRIKAAKRLKAEGLFHLEVPARSLFRNFDAICSGVSADFYRNQLGVFVDPSKLIRMSDADSKDD